MNLDAFVLIINTFFGHCYQINAYTINTVITLIMYRLKLRQLARWRQAKSTIHSTACHSANCKIWQSWITSFETNWQIGAELENKPQSSGSFTGLEDKCIIRKCLSSNEFLFTILNVTYNEKFLKWNRNKLY